MTWSPYHRQQLTYFVFCVGAERVRVQLPHITFGVRPPHLTLVHKELHMSTVVNLGHTISMAVAFLDQNGNPMLTPPVPDSPPAWSNTTPATETLAPSASGLSCVATPVAAGSDEVDLVVTVGGVAFKALLDVTVQPAPQVLTSVAIVPTVQ